MQYRTGCDGFGNARCTGRVPAHCQPLYALHSGVLVLSVPSQPLRTIMWCDLLQHERCWLGSCSLPAALRPPFWGAGAASMCPSTCICCCGGAGCRGRARWSPCFPCFMDTLTKALVEEGCGVGFGISVSSQCRDDAWRVSGILVISGVSAGWRVGCSISVWWRFAVSAEVKGISGA